MKIFKKLSIISILFISILFISSCAASPSLLGAEYVSLPGFWYGLWHGLCAPFALIGIAFGMNIGFYEIVNSGNWYNFGFLLGAYFWPAVYIN
jgi:hypothetical protein